MIERRRGQALEDAVLGAAWSELLEGGYGNFSIDAVAKRANTSRTVLYRRWPCRADLAIAALRYSMQNDPASIPDTGSLRGDLIDLMQQMSNRRALLITFTSLQMDEFFAETNTGLGDLRRKVFQGVPNTFQTLFSRSVMRGELDGSKLTPRIVSLLPDLLRHELLMTLKPVPTEVISEFVDCVFLPLVSLKPGNKKKTHRMRES